MAGSTRCQGMGWLPRASTALVRGSFGVLATIADIAAIVLSALAAGVVIAVLYGVWPGPLVTLAQHANVYFLP